jgi:hypothetical protein
MSLMMVRLELGRTAQSPQGDPRHGYEFVAPLDGRGHIDAKEWARFKTHCMVRQFRPGQEDRTGELRHVGRGWRFDYDKTASDDDEPFFKLDRHEIVPGLYVTITEDDGVERPFRIASIQPAGAVS